MNTHLEEMIDALRTARTRYAKAERYYRGHHDLAFATEKFENAFGSLFREFALNVCPAICDAVRDKLIVTGFVQRTSQSGDDAAAQFAVDSIWHRNRMQLRSGEVHRESLVAGDAYAIVWPDESGLAAIYPNRASQCAVVYDDERPGVIDRAVKYWQTRDGSTRLNVFHRDHIERYVSAKPTEGTLPDARGFMPFNDPASPSPDAVIENPYGVVPVFHLANNADIGSHGRSELEPAIPVQDGLNKAVLDMLVAMEYSAYRQRWAAGIEIEYDNEGKPSAPFRAGVDHVWISENPNARFGDFNTADLDQFLKVKDSFRIDIASVTGTPMYYLLPHTRGFPSGEAMQRAESRFVAKVRDRQSAFGSVWSQVMEFALRIDGLADVRLETRWEDPSEQSERARLETILLKKQIGISDEQALREAGY